MNNLKITVGEKEKMFSGPSSWEELTARQFLKVFKLSRAAVVAGYVQFLALKIVYGIPARVSKHFFSNPEQGQPKEDGEWSVAQHAALLGIELIKTLKWIWEDVPLRRWYFSSVSVFGRKFIGPDDSFRNLTFGQYMFTERFFDAARKEDERYKENLHLFLGTLFRPVSAKAFDVKRIESNAWWLKFMSPKKQEAILFNYAGLRYQLTLDFPDIFPKPADNASKSAQAKNASGWLDVVLSITKTDVEMLYSYEKAELWLVMKVLNNLIRENKEAEARMNKK